VNDHSVDEAGRRPAAKHGLADARRQSPPPESSSAESTQDTGLGAWRARAIALLVAVAMFFLLKPFGWNVETRFVAAWDLAVLVLVGEGWWVILRSDPERARRRAKIEDPGRPALLAVAVGFSVVSLVAAVVVISQAPLDPLDAPSGVRLALGLAAIVGAWTLMHTAYALHYARLYYADPDTAGSLVFYGGPPDDADFAYFAFGVGMTFQVPDVNVTSREMRRSVLFHQLISFAYNTTILALIINLVAGRI
jgi:uncharacterized membrane protein